jgi:2-polyprenyl-3-methyl-5-hydroxy-6-metoxy-1,4-benzoquinol methylase
MASLDLKIDLFIEIINLPIHLGWSECFEDRSNNWYKYLHSLELISNAELNSVYEEKKPIQRNKCIEVFLRDCNYHFNRGVEGKVIADIGAGWGHLSFWMLLNGAKKVYPVGDSYRSDFIQRLFKELMYKKLLPETANLEAIGRWINKGDTKIAEQIASEELDFCIFNDVFEHIPFYRLPSVLLSCYNNLKKGGMLISKTHNTNNPNTYREAVDIWNETEAVKEITSRKKILELEHGVNDQNAYLLAKNTRGMVRSEFDQAVQAYKTKGIIPDYDPQGTSYDIIYDEAHEGPTDYNKTVSIMRKVGFKSKVYPALYNRRKTRSFQGIAKAVPSLFLNLHIFDETVCFEGVK